MQTADRRSFAELSSRTPRRSVHLVTQDGCEYIEARQANELLTAQNENRDDSDQTMCCPEERPKDAERGAQQAIGYSVAVTTASLTPAAQRGRQTRWRPGSVGLYIQSSGNIGGAELLRCRPRVAFLQRRSALRARISRASRACPSAPRHTLQDQTLRQRDTALSFDRRILAATRGYLASEAQEALL